MSSPAPIAASRKGRSCSACIRRSCGPKLRALVEGARLAPKALWPRRVAAYPGERRRQREVSPARLRMLPAGTVRFWNRAGPGDVLCMRYKNPPAARGKVRMPTGPARRGWPDDGLRVSGEGQGRHSRAASRPPHPGLLLACREKEESSGGAADRRRRARRLGRLRRGNAAFGAISSGAPCGIPAARHDVTDLRPCLSFPAWPLPRS
jgi:hypothetical protein